MKNVFKKLTALVLGAVTAIAFTSCGNTPAGSTESNGNSSGGNEQVRFVFRGGFKGKSARKTLYSGGRAEGKLR